MPLPTQSDVATDEHVFLIGRPPIAEYLGFVEQTLGGRDANRQELVDEWRAANDHIQELELTEAGLADSPPIVDLTGKLRTLADELLGDPLVQRNFAIVPVGVGSVELDRLVVFQKNINLDYVDYLTELLGESPTRHKMFRFALPTDRRYDVPVQSMQIAQNGWVFTSPSMDFRPLQSTVLSGDAVPGLTLDGVPAAVVAAPVGYGSNFLSAIHANGRLILNNGSHRAYTLRAAGHTHAPCLIQTVSRIDELHAIASGEVTANVDAYLSAPRPPMLKDYFDERLRMVGELPRRVRQVRVVVNYEQVDAPGS